MANEGQSEKLRELGEVLQTDRLVKIYVGGCTKPYLIQQALLTTLSDFFVRALANEKSFGGEHGTLSCPDDHQTAWEMLLFWRLNDELEYKHISDMKLKFDMLVHCWVLGDKYNVKKFQDVVMLELIATAADEYISLETVKLAFDNTPPNSVLRTFMAEEVVLRIKKMPEYSPHELGTMDGTVGFTTELMQAMDRYTEKSNSFGYRKRTGNLEEWLKYMVGDGPKEHWIYEL